MIRETPQDRENQRIVAAFLKEKFGWTIIETAPLDPVDCVIGNERSVCEIKNRYCSFRDFNTLMIGCRKVHDIVSRAHAMDRDGFLAIAWDDAVGILRVYNRITNTPASFVRREWGGRYDRPGDSTALEPCYYFPVEWFLLYRVRLARCGPSINAWK